MPQLSDGFRIGAISLKLCTAEQAFATAATVLTVNAAAAGTKARYVRLYRNGNTSDELNHYVEFEVFGR